MSLPLTILTARFERRKLLLCLILCFALSHIAVLWVASFGSLLAARICVALCHSIFWSIMTPLAARMAPKGKRALGLACVMGGTIVATVMGLPIGTKLGQLFGWQEAFAVIGAVALCVLVMIWLVLPPCPATSAGALKSLPVILKRPALLQLYFLTAVTELGHFTAYSYIAPILQADGGFSPTDVVTVLFVFGISGIIGAFTATKVVDKHISGALTLPLVLTAVSLLLIYPACATLPSILTLCIVWGAAVTAVSLAFQTIVLNVAPTPPTLQRRFSPEFSISGSAAAHFWGA